MRRDVRQVGETPFAALDVILLRHTQFEQVTDRRANHILVVFVVVVFFHTAADDPRNVVSNGWFLGDDKGFAHFMNLWGVVFVWDASTINRGSRFNLATQNPRSVLIVAWAVSRLRP